MKGVILWSVSEQARPGRRRCNLPFSSSSSFGYHSSQDVRQSDLGRQEGRKEGWKEVRD
jgi:hypothetical protein